MYTENYEETGNVVGNITGDPTAGEAYVTENCTCNNPVALATVAFESDTSPNVTIYIFFYSNEQIEE